MAAKASARSVAKAETPWFELSAAFSWLVAVESGELGTDGRREGELGPLDTYI